MIYGLQTVHPHMRSNRTLASASAARNRTDLSALPGRGRRDLDHLVVRTSHPSAQLCRLNAECPSDRSTKIAAITVIDASSACG